MLVLFVMTVIYLKVERKKIIVQIDELTNIIQLKEQFKPLQESGAFYYLEGCKKFIARDLMGKEIFDPGKTKILPEYVDNTIAVGKQLESFLNTMEEENDGFSYLLVIEGNMANTYDKRYSEDSEYGYKTSYERALAVYNLWLKHGVDFRKSNVEVLLSGSGFNGLCRESKEENNKRFSVQIIPKIGSHL